MPFVEVFVPRGALSPSQRDQLHRRMVRAVMEVEGAPDTAAARAISWLVLHEIDSWSIGGELVDDQTAPPIVVRVAVPAGSLDDARRERMMSVVTDVLAEVDGSDRLRQRPDAWVHIAEIPDGNWGAFGRVVRLPDIAAFVTAPVG